MIDNNTDTEITKQKEAEARKVDEILRRGDLREPFKEFIIPVKFEGELKVLVPDCAPLGEVLARKKGISVLVAIPDSPDATESDAFDDWACLADPGEEMSDDQLERIWESAKVEVKAGLWSNSD